MTFPKIYTAALESDAALTEKVNETTTKNVRKVFERGYAVWRGTFSMHLSVKPQMLVWKIIQNHYSKSTRYLLLVFSWKYEENRKLWLGDG